MRSRSPSLIFTCTLTTSPEASAGILSFVLASRALIISAIAFSLHRVSCRFFERRRIIARIFGNYKAVTEIHGMKTRLHFTQSETCSRFISFICPEGYICIMIFAIKIVVIEPSSLPISALPQATRYPKYYKTPNGDNAHPAGSCDCGERLPFLRQYARWLSANVRYAGQSSIAHGCNPISQTHALITNTYIQY